MRLIQRGAIIISVPLTTIFGYSTYEALQISKNVKIPQNEAITLYQYKICPFCNKVKAVLDFMDIKYHQIEVNPLTKQELTHLGEYKKVPVAQIDGKVIGESGAIIASILNTAAKNSSQSHFNDNFLSSNSTFWMEWCDKSLAVLLYPNITRTFDESWECFSYTEDVKTWTTLMRYSNRLLGPVAMYFVNSKLKKKYGIVDERAELRALLNEWTAAVGNKPFLNGKEATIPDIVVFGVIKSIENTQTFRYIMEDVVLREWYNRVVALMPRASC